MPDKATYVRTEALPLGRLQPFPGNAKIGNVPKILESLCRNGQYRSLVVREHQDGTLTVLAGNHTCQALAAHGPGDCGTTTPHGDDMRPCAICENEPWAPAARCEIVTCDDETATRINLTDNASNEGTWDELALASLIEGLGGDLTGTGYDDADIAHLVTALDVVIEDEPDGAYDDEPDEDEQDQGPARPAAAAAAPPTGPAGQQQPAAAAPGSTLLGVDAPAGLLPAFSHERVPMVLHYAQADRDEAQRLVAAARTMFPADEAPAIVLRSLRTLVAVLDSQHDPDGVVTVAALLRAAGASR